VLEKVHVPPVVADTVDPGDTAIEVLPLSAGLIVIVGVVLVSLIVIVPLVATTKPPVLPKRTDTVNVCGPSVVKSALAATVKVPVLFATANDPLTAVKSPSADVM
jgi:hypothetical protein